MEHATMILTEAVLFAAMAIGVICIAAVVGFIFIEVMGRGRDL